MDLDFRVDELIGNMIQLASKGFIENKLLSSKLCRYIIKICRLVYLRCCQTFIYIYYIFQALKENYLIGESEYNNLHIK